MDLPRNDAPVPVPAPFRITISTPKGTRSLDYDGNGPLRIGRDPAAAVVLDVKNVSRSPCEVRPLEDGSFELVDLGSRNGTFLNGSRIERSPIRPGDAITVGAARITFGAAPTAAERVGDAPAAASRIDEAPAATSQALTPGGVEEIPPAPPPPRIRRPSPPRRKPQPGAVTALGWL